MWAIFIPGYFSFLLNLNSTIFFLKLGECWAGNSNQHSYARHGFSQGCIQDDFESCRNGYRYCMGQRVTNMVYRIGKFNVYTCFQCYVRRRHLSTTYVNDWETFLTEKWQINNYHNNINPLFTHDLVLSNRGHACTKNQKIYSNIIMILLTSKWLKKIVEFVCLPIYGIIQRFECCRSALITFHARWNWVATVFNIRKMKTLKTVDLSLTEWLRDTPSLSWPPVLKMAAFS